MQLKAFRTTLFLLIPFLAMTEGGAMYQRLVNVPLWIHDMNMLKQFHGIGFYFFYFTPPVLILWIAMVISGWKYKGRYKMLLLVNHFFYFTIIASTAFYFVPFLGKYAGNTEALIAASDVEDLKTWAIFSMIRQTLGFIVILIYTYLLGVINREVKNRQEISIMNNAKAMKQFTYPEDLYPFQSRWKTIDGNRVHYIDEGRGETILFCHPPVSSSFMYRRIIKELSKNFRCIALDFPGFGLSDTGEGSNYRPSINAQSGIVDGLVKALELKSIYLMMQECGGHAAIKVFLEQPEKLRGIILTDTIIFPVSTYPRIKTMLSVINSSVFNFINGNFNFLIRAMTRFGINNRKLSLAERNTYKAMFATKEIRRMSTHMLYQLVAEEELLVKIQASFETNLNSLPTLIIYGEKDPLTVMGIPQRIHKMMANSELHIIKGEGHFPHEGAPDEMSLIIRNWLKK